LTALTLAKLPENKKRLLELYYGCKKVKDYEEEDLKKMFKFILALCKLVGVTEAPDNEIILLLIDHIQEHHKNFSKEEIQKAFSMAMAGKFNFEFVHYNRITPQLISKTLNAYLSIVSKEVLEYENKIILEEAEELRKKNKLTPKQALIQRVKLCFDGFDSYKSELEKSEDDRNEVRDWGSLNYFFLESLGLINYSTNQKLEIKELAKIKVEKEKRRQQTKYDRKGIAELIQQMNSENPPALLLNESRQIALDRYFDNLIEFELVLEKEVKDKLIKHKKNLYVEVGNMLK
jgi:hypothetical protein